MRALRDSTASIRVGPLGNVPTRTVVAFGVVLATVFLTGVASYASLRAINQNRGLIRRTSNRLLSIEHLVSLLRDAETGARGYLLTGNPEYMGPYQRALERAPAVLDAAEALGVGHEAQRATLAELRALSSQELTELSLTVELMRKGQRDEAIRRVETGRGQALMERARAIALTVSAQTEQEVARERYEQSTAVQQSFFVSLGGGLLLLCLAAVAALSVIRDYRERERVYQERRAVAEFQERLVSVVGHEIRTPLSVIATSVGALQRANVSELQAKPLARIQRAAKNIESTLTSLLDYSHARLGGGIPLVRGAADLNEIARQVVDGYAAIQPDRPVALDAIGEVQGEWDAERLSRALSNLVGNALKYGATDGPVSVRIQGEGDRVQVAVTNRGPVLPSEVLPNLFEPFRRASPKDSHAKSSLGLGLYIVQEIVRAHGGTIAARSTGVDGTTFSFELPRHLAV